MSQDKSVARVRSSDERYDWDDPFDRVEEALDRLNRKLDILIGMAILAVIATFLVVMDLT